MDMIYFPIILYVLAFFAGVAFMEGRARSIYLVVLTVLAVAGALDQVPGLRSRLVQFFFGVQRSAASAAVESARSAPPAPVPFKPFYVYQDKNSRNHFTPSGYMPDGYCIGFDDAWQADVKEGTSSIAIVYDVACSRSGRKWAGIYWQNPPNNWGSQDGGYDLTGATKLVFWARGESGGERIAEFRVGGLGAKEQYPDSTTAVLGQVTLTREWQEYTIDLRGHDLSHISGGFAWSTNVDVNPESCTFYLDEIRFE